MSIRRFKQTTALCLVTSQVFFITLCLMTIGLDCVINGLSYKEIILQRNYRKMTNEWSFSYDSFAKL